MFNTLDKNLSQRLVTFESNMMKEMKSLELRAFAEINALKIAHNDSVLLADANKKDTEEQIRNMNDKIEKVNETLEGAVEAESKNVNLLESQAIRITELEKSLHRNLQHGRKCNVEINGIPSEVGDSPNALIDAVCKILRGIDILCSEADIEACHRLSSRNLQQPKATIVLFKSRKITEEIWEKRKKLKDVDRQRLEIAGLNIDSAIYINPSLTPYFKTLAFNARLLRKNKLIDNVMIGDDGIVKLKLLNGDIQKVLHKNDLTSRFKDFPHFKFN